MHCRESPHERRAFAVVPESPEIGEPPRLPRLYFGIGRVEQAFRHGEFQSAVLVEYERHAAKIESAMPLPADLRSRVQLGLENMYGPGLTALFTQSPLLIGGMRIKVGSDVYDNSVRSALAALAKSFGIMNTN